jgi:hypothetical protein
MSQPFTMIAIILYIELSMVYNGLYGIAYALYTIVQATIESLGIYGIHLEFMESTRNLRNPPGISGIGGGV